MFQLVSEQKFWKYLKKKNILGLVGSELIDVFICGMLCVQCDKMCVVLFD